LQHAQRRTLDKREDVHRARQYHDAGTAIRGKRRGPALGASATAMETDMGNCASGAAGAAARATQLLGRGRINHHGKPSDRKVHAIGT
jgi:hypothetical protein